jgi:hypothetical protein
LSANSNFANAATQAANPYGLFTRAADILTRQLRLCIGEVAVSVISRGGRFQVTLEAVS